MFKRQKGGSGHWSSVSGSNGTWGKSFSHYLCLGSPSLHGDSCSLSPPWLFGLEWMGYDLQYLFTAGSTSRVQCHFGPPDTTVPQKAFWTLWLWSDLHKQVRMTFWTAEETSSGAQKNLGLSFPGYHTKEKKKSYFLLKIKNKNHFIILWIQDIIFLVCTPLLMTRHSTCLPYHKYLWASWFHFHFSFTTIHRGDSPWSLGNREGSNFLQVSAECSVCNQHPNATIPLPSAIGW